MCTYYVECVKPVCILKEHKRGQEKRKKPLLWERDIVDN